MADVKDTKLKILVADDDDTIRDFVVLVLQNELSCDIYQAGDGKQALKISREMSPDLVLLDMIMPEPDGFEVAQRLKSMRIPFVAMTSLTGAEIIHRLNALGSYSFLAKPVSKAQLLGTVTAALSHIKHLNALERHANNNCDICTARGAISAYLSIHPDQAYDVINEMARDQQGNAMDTAQFVNQFLVFLANAKSKHIVQQERRKKRHRE